MIQQVEAQRRIALGEWLPQVTILFQADIDAQAIPYATGVLAVITSASVAVFLSALRQRETVGAVWFGIVSAMFIYAL